MSDLFLFARLAPKQVDQAWPIIQSSLPGVHIDDWRSFAASMNDWPEDKGGIVAVKNGSYLHGLFSYTIAPHLTHGQVLNVDNVFVLDLFTPGMVADVLLDAVEDVALRHGCLAVHTLLPVTMADDLADNGHWLAARFRSRGHCVETKLLCKRFGLSNDMLRPLTRRMARA